MKSVANSLRGTFDLSGTLPGESPSPPSDRPELVPPMACMVDSFLHDDDEVEDLCEQGVLPRHFCSECKSTLIEPVNFMSHSFSMSRLSYLFEYLLPPLRPQDAVMDIGSRLGAALVGAFAYSGSNAIVGVEINDQWCQLQAKIIKEFHMEERVSVLCGDVCQFPVEVRRSRVLILHDMFTFFLDQAQAGVVWRFLHENVSPGALLVTCPPMDRLPGWAEAGIQLDGWLEQEPAHRDTRLIPADLDTGEGEVVAYRVRPQLPSVFL